MKLREKPFLWLLLLASAYVSAQTSPILELNIDQAEQLFFKNNFLLLAKQYDINAAEAQVIQAKLYPNPELSADLVAYDGTNDRYFPLGKTGQIAGGIEQLILLGGKRKAKIDLAILDKKRAAAELTELTRNLQLELWQAFYTLHAQQKLVETYDVLLERLDKLIAAYEVQTRKNNIPLKDLVRLKSVYVKVSNDKSEESSVLIDQMQKLNLLLGTASEIRTSFPDERAKTMASKTISYEDILNKATIGRSDVEQLKIESEWAAKNVSLQKKTAIPDLTLRAAYNQTGDAFHNQVGFGIGFPLPIFDGNRGNIKAAKIEQQKTLGDIEYKKLEITNEVQAAYKNFVRSTEEYNRINSVVDQDFDAVFAGINSNFLKGNVSMMEFADFFESYDEAQTEVQRVKRQLALAAAQINYVSGTKNF